MIKINRLLNKPSVVSLTLTVTLASLLLVAPAADAEPGIDTRPSNQTCVAPERPDTGEVMLQQVFQNLSFRVLMTIEYPPDDPSYLFGLDNAGRIHRFPNDPDTTEKTVALNLRSLFDGTSVSGQSGMMDMAFHPDFANNGELYVAYTVPSDPIVSYVARYRSFDGGETFSSNGEIILSEEQRGNQHNIGSLFFGRDGYLYIGFGDSLRRRFAADTSRRYGKLLRIDVDSGSPYAIPPDNPFVAGGGLPEIYAYGFRNPFRITQDSGGTGEIWGGDVGNHDWEEVNKIVKGGNYGWPTYEGSHCFDGPCPDPTLIPPVHDYSHNEGCSVIGGFVYRGSRIPSLTGKYLFGDYCSGVISTIDDSGATVEVNPLITTGISIQDFTETPTGEIYVNDATSRIMQLMPDASSGSSDNFPQNLSDTGCVDPADPTRVAQGVIPFDVNAELWSDGAGKRRWMAIPDGTQITVQADGDWDLPIGTVLIKEFSHNGSPFETRLLVRHDDGEWAGYTYEWNASLTDATLVPAEGLAKTIDGQLDWFYPSQAQCQQCHSQAAGRALGPETAQLNGDILYPSGITSNQLETLEHIGMFANSLGGLPQDLPALVDVNDTSATLTERSRSYLHSNCANCHRPNGPGQGPMDFRFQTEFEDMDACNVAPGLGDLGVPGARLITPGSAASSVISLRMHTRGADQMPPLGTELVHDDGTAAVDAWINSIEACPATAPPGGGAYLPDSSGRFVMEAEHFDANTSAGGRDWVPDSTAGYVGDSAMQSVPDTFTKVNSNLNFNSPRMDYQVDVPAQTTYTVWVRGLGLSGSRDSIWVGVDGNDAAATNLSLNRGNYGWSSAGQVSLSAGIHTVNVWMREDGSIVDRVLLTPLSTPPSGDGPPESARDGGGGGGPPVNDPPVLSPVGPRSATEDQVLSFDVSASDADVPVLSADLSLLPGSPTFVDNNNGTGSFNWTPPVGSAPGPYSVTFTATDATDSSLSASETISIDVQAEPPGGGGGGSGAYQPDGSGQFVMEAENFDSNTSAGGRDWAADFTAGFVGDSAMQSVPDSFTKVNSNLNSNSPRMDYQVELAASATLNVWVRAVGLSGSRDSIWVGVNGNDGGAQNVTLNRGSYGWSSAGQVTLAAGVQTINVWMREDGSIVDRILLTPSSSTPTGDGPPESTRGDGGGGPPPTNDPPVLAPVGDRSATENEALTFNVSASDADTPVLSADLSLLPGSPSFVDNNNGTGTFSWSPPTGSAPGPYSVTFTATDSADVSLTSAETIAISVQADAPPGGGGGSGAYQPDGSGQFVMEAENFDANNAAGIRDWVDDFTPGYVGSGAMQSVPNTFHKVTSGLNANSPRLDYQVELAAPVTLNVWVRGVGLSGSRDSVWFGVNGDDSAARNVTLTRGSYGWSGAGQITLAAGVQTINVWMREDGSIVDRILLTPLSSTPSGDGPPESPRGDGGGGSALPLTDDFGDGDADGWSFVDDSTQFPSNWSVVNQALVQSEHTNSQGTDVTETYHRGSYAILDASAGLTDYRLVVDVTPDAESGDDIGVMFRYANANNYYRFTLNLLNGFARLEENVNGTYMTLASDHRGYTPGALHTIVVEVEGPLMQVFVDGDPLFAATDTSHAAGGIALFSRDNSTFDNVSLADNGSTAEIVIATPEAHDVLPGAPLNLDVAAVARNAPATNASVQFQYHAGGTPTLCNAATESSPGYFTAQCPGVPAGDYTVEALLLDNGVEVDRDSNAAVAVGSPAFLSHRYDAIGNSISRGVDDNTASDNLGISSPLVRSNAGWTALLTDLLVTATGSPNLVGNEAISGDRASDTWNTRLFSIIERNPDSDRALVMLGTNDSNTFNAATPAELTTNLQNIIDELQLSGRQTVYLALLPPTWGRNSNPVNIYPDPLAPTAERNQNIITYNTAIQGMLPQTGVLLGPDFFSCFLTPTVNRFSLFDDPLHPNALGYRFMAALWRDAILAGPVVAPMDPCPSPVFILENLDAYTYDLRQNLLEEGDRYYRDAAFTLTNIPPELADGVWVQTSNADNANADTDFVSFSVGGTSSTVYIAYDTAGSPPTSSTHTFTVDTLSEALTTSDGAVGAFGIVSAGSVTGTVTIGGTKSAGSPGVQQAYLVIVVPD